MGIVRLDKRNYEDVQPVYQPWWDSADDSTRTGIYVAIVLLAALAVGCFAWWIVTNRRRSQPYAPYPAYTGTRPDTHVSPWNETQYKSLNASKDSLDAYGVPQPPPRAYSYETDGNIKKDEIRAVLYKHDKI